MTLDALDKGVRAACPDTAGPWGTGPRQVPQFPASSLRTALSREPTTAPRVSRIERLRHQAYAYVLS